MYPANSGLLDTVTITPYPLATSALKSASSRAPALCDIRHTSSKASAASSAIRINLNQVGGAKAIAQLAPDSAASRTTR